MLDKISAKPDINKQISDEVQKEMAAKGKNATENDFVNAHIRISRKYGVDVKDLRQRKSAYAISARSMGFK